MASAPEEGTPPAAPGACRPPICCGSLIILICAHAARQMRSSSVPYTLRACVQISLQNPTAHMQIHSPAATSMQCNAPADPCQTYSPGQVTICVTRDLAVKATHLPGELLGLAVGRLELRLQPPRLHGRHHMRVMHARTACWTPRGAQCPLHSGCRKENCREIVDPKGVRMRIANGCRWEGACGKKHTSAGGKCVSYLRLGSGGAP